jgi:hypothetical protein
MLVYILTASQVKSLALAGRGGNCSNWSLRSKEEEMYEGIFFDNGFSILSAQRPSP